MQTIKLIENFIYIAKLKNVSKAYSENDIRPQ